MFHDLHGCRRSHAEQNSGDFTIPGARTHYPPSLELEPVHLDITLEFNIEALRAKGEVVTTIKANRVGASSITLEARDFNDLAVRDLDGHALMHSYDGKQIKVRWSKPFADGETRRLGVAYRIEKPIDGIRFSSPDSSYPERARWVASDHETERARYWLPCIDYPAVRTALTFHLRAPADLTILAAGLLTGVEKHSDNTKTAHWQLDYPCPSYLICFAIGDFVTFKDQNFGDIAIEYFAAKGRATPADLERSFGRTGEIMEWLVKRVGQPFPFPKYFQFALPGIGGAMENISLVSWDDLFVVDEILGSELGHWIESTNVHEMAHSYFGDAVVIRDYAHAWLKESWATYMQACWLEDKAGEDEMRYELFNNARVYFGEADGNYIRPIVTRTFNSSWDMYDRHLYPGGACRLHMLRRQLGDADFWAGVADYLGSYSQKTVETDDFRRKLEEHSGRSLGKYFDQWFHGRGYPKLKVEWGHDDDKHEGRLSFEQTQVAEGKTDTGLIEAFELPMVVAWEDDAGAWHRREFMITERKHVFVLDMPKAPKQIRIDPDGSLLFKLEFNQGEEMQKRALSHGPDIVARILAAEELVKSGKASNFALVVAACKSEKFWGTRAAMAQAIGQSKHASAIPAIVELMAIEKNRLVLATLADAAGRYRDSRLAKALVDLLAREQGYRVRGAIYRSLGLQRGEEHIATLSAGAADKGRRGVAASGALAGLAHTRTEAGYRALVGKSAYGVLAEDIRPVAAAALATAVETLPERFPTLATDELIETLRDPHFRVRMAAIQSLGLLGEPRAIPAMLAARPTLAEQDRPRVDRAIARIRSRSEGATAADALRKDLEEMRDRNFKLEDRIAQLEARFEAKKKES